MVSPHMSGDLYHKYRPKRFNELTGHKEVVKSLKAAVNAEEPSQAFLLLGESGTGKTTSARIMALTLNCTSRMEDLEPCLECPSCKIILSGSCLDVIELNAADHRGIDAIREVSSKMALSPIQVNCKVYIFDECHALTKEAQNSFLKVLEEAPKQTYIILCTTSVEKILPTVKNRCQLFKFKQLKSSEIVGLLQEVCVYEGRDLELNLFEKIADVSYGSPRNALVKLQQIFQMGDSSAEEMEVFLESEETDSGEVLALFSSFNGGSWPNLVTSYEGVKELGPPQIGMILAGYFRNKLLSCKDLNDARLLASNLALFVDPLEEGKLGENKLILNLFRAFENMKSFTKAASYGAKRY